MSVHKMDINKTSSGTAPKPAPVPQVDKKHFADMRKLERNPTHLYDRVKAGK